MPQILASEVVLDRGVYPRHNPNEMHISTLRNALRAGAVFPPILIEAETRRCVDGFHRTLAYRRELGETALIEAEERVFATEQEFFLESVRLNAVHGLHLSPYDKALITVKATELGIPEDLLAGALQMPEHSTMRLRDQRTALAEGGVTMPLKGSAKHLAGRELSPRQQSAHKRASGMTAMYHATQLLNMIEGDLVDFESAGTRLKLRELHELLGRLFNGVEQTPDLPERLAAVATG